jgi:gliding motility-associated-like protein
MKRLLLFFIQVLLAANCFAGHIAGGEVYYKYLGPGSTANTSSYEISLRLFRECSAGGANTAPMPVSVVMAIYNNSSPYTQVGSQITVARTSFQQLQLTTPNPCINNPPSICYQVGVFTFTKELPNSAGGYIAMFQTCCRTANIDNIQEQTFTNAAGQSTTGEGATYTGQIPGTNSLPSGTNSSPIFSLKDTTLVCQFSPFKLDFSATDPDAGDSLSYSFCSAYDRGVTTGAADVNYTPPPYNAVTYKPGFTGTTPLGPDVVINPVTGIISGIAPGAGRYVVTVCIGEWRKGQLISQHRKDFTLIVSNCTLAGAALKPSYVTCNGTVLQFQNESTNASINSYLWDFGVPNLTTDTSSSPTPSYDYQKSGKDSGTFTVKLKVSTVNGCLDSTTSQVKVYPGFIPGFTVTGTCFINSYLFSDTSKIKYGSVISRRWDFGDLTSSVDTASSKDTAWKYPAPTTVQVKLIVGNNIGCVDTVIRSITITDKPTLSIPFRDTLICSIDTLALRVNTSSGSVQWTPANGPNRLRILNSTSNAPLVFPRDTTKYYVTVNDNGCTNTDSVTVNVLPFITVDAGPDTGICRTDSFYLKPVSDALQYVWSASTGETVSPVKNPLIRPLVNTRYYVIANLGKCQSRDSVNVRVAPYPAAAAGSDMTICYGTRVQLNGTVTGSTFSWSPTASLINENTLTPVAGPTRTTAYVLTATDTIGCPKPKTDTVIVTVIQPIRANAGNDTAAVPNEPLQLNASGGTSYTWDPASFLSDPTIANPIAVFDNTIDSITYTVRVSDGGCSATDQVTVRVYKNGPDILVPSGFTPNGDGKNDVIRPALVGISKFNFFSIYNRWGQLVFTTNEVNKGWDGNFSGVAQPAGTYVYQAQGTDYRGKILFRKGTVVLIR